MFHRLSHVSRSGQHEGFSALELAAGQSVMTAVVATAIAGRDIWTAASVSRNPGDFAGTLWPNWSQPYEFALVLWAGLGCEALAFSLQLYGQRKTPATTAQVRCCRWWMASNIESWFSFKMLVICFGCRSCWMLSQTNIVDMGAYMQVIYASVPIWAALLSLLLLSEQEFGARGWLGACLVISASVAMGTCG